MNSNKQSSIEWYERQVWDLLIRFENKEITLGQYGVTRVDLFNQAKEMHKAEIINARVDGDTWSTAYKEMRIVYAENYYNETFNQTDL
jgi:hypothetical protein